MNFKVSLMLLGKTQVDLIKALSERGISTNPPQISASLNERLNTPKAQKIRNESAKIIEEWGESR